MDSSDTGSDGRLALLADDGSAQLQLSDEFRADVPITCLALPSGVVSVDCEKFRFVRLSCNRHVELGDVLKDAVSREQLYWTAAS